MDKKEVPSSIDAALAHVDPDRRKFLGILLAGAAALPLLRSSSMAAQDKSADMHVKVFPKNDLKAAGESSAIKDGNSNTIKGESAGTIKDKGSPIKGESPALKIDPKFQSTPIKGASSPAHK